MSRAWRKKMAHFCNLFLQEHSGDTEVTEEEITGRCLTTATQQLLESTLLTYGTGELRRWLMDTVASLEVRVQDSVDDK
jgi:hypothetical protein